MDEDEMNGQADEHMDRCQKDNWRNKPIDDEWSDGWIDAHMRGWMDEQTDSWRYSRGDRQHPVAQTVMPSGL